jgi:hypothetical protein
LWWLGKTWGVFGFIFLVMARSAFQPGAKAVLKADNRKPVLLLAVVH